MDFGDIEKALPEIEKAGMIAEASGNFSQKIRNLIQKGDYFLKMGFPNEAKQTAEQMKSLIESGLFQYAIRSYYYLMGRIEFEQKSYARSIDYLEKAKALLPFEYSGWDLRLQIFFALGRAYSDSGQWDKARDEFETIGHLTLGRMYSNNIYVRAFYELGKVYQATGNSTKALEKYKIFLDLWKDADPGIEEVADAKQRLAELEGR